MIVSRDRDQITVLIVEDEPANRVLLRAVLARATDPAVRSARFLEASTLADARLALGAGRVDLVLLDVRLPDGSGLDLARELLALGDARPLVLILSASVLTGDRDAAVNAGCDAFLGKPYRPSELTTLVSELLSRNPDIAPE